MYGLVHLFLSSYAKARLIIVTLPVIGSDFTIFLADTAGDLPYLMGISLSLGKILRHSSCNCCGLLINGNIGFDS